MSRNVASIFRKPVRSGEFPLVEHRWPLQDQMIGIEVEVDQVGGVRTVMPTQLRPYWNSMRDGSLRNGQEFILAAPLRGNYLATAIHQFFDGGTLINRTTTGSTHIHLDMTEEGTTASTVQLLVMLMFILEPAVFAIGDPGREWCGFTNKLSTAPDELLGSILNLDLSSDDEPLLRVCNDGNIGRYYGFNIMALAQHGSVEFRYFPTATSVGELTAWVELVQSFKKAATELDNLSALQAICESDENYNTFISTYFSSWASTILTVVPRFLALSAFQKALAIASSHQLSRGSTSNSFDERAITGNKAFAKFLKRTNVPMDFSSFYIIPPTRSVPNAGAKGKDSILIVEDGLYVVCNRSWETLVSYDIHDMLTSWDIRQIKRWYEAFTTYRGQLLTTFEATPDIGPRYKANFPARVDAVIKKLATAISFYAHNNPVAEEEVTPVRPPTNRPVRMRPILPLPEVISPPPSFFADVYLDDVSYDAGDDE